MLHFRQSGGKTSESAPEMHPMCCLCNSAFNNGPWGCSQVLAPCLWGTHTHTLTKIMMMIIMVMTTGMRVYVATEARSLNP